MIHLMARQPNNLLQPVNFDNWPYLNVCAHRGAGKLAPENTLAAFEHGASFGHRMFEFDVKLSKDNVSLLLHDDTLDRTTSGAGAASDWLMADLLQLDAGVLQPEFRLLASAKPSDSATASVIRLPSFQLISEWLLARDFLANIEIKPSPGREAETGAQIAREAWAIWTGYAETQAGSRTKSQAPSSTQLIPPLLSSFSEVALTAARDAVPDLPRALLLDKLPSNWLERCQALGVVALDCNFRELTPEVFAICKSNRLRVASYTINDLSIMQRLFDEGLDCAITDIVDRVQP